MVKPPFEEVYPEIQALIRTHQWSQQLRGMSQEDLCQEMRLLAWKAYTKWDPARGPLKVMWWSYVVNYRTTYLAYLDRSKRRGVQLCSMDVWEEFPVPSAEEVPVNGVPCPIDDLDLKRMWAMYELQVPVHEIMSLLNLSQGQYFHRRLLLQRVLNGEELPATPTVCEWCGEPLVGKRRGVRFCSKAHYRAAYHQRVRLQRLSASSTADTSASSSAL